MYTPQEQLIRHGVQLTFLYQGVQRESAKNAEEIHVWAVRMRGPGGTSEFKDAYRATVNEYRSILANETDVSRQYLVTFVNDMLLIEGSGPDFVKWLDLKDIAFGKTVRDTPENRALWKERYDQQFSTLRQFRVLLGGAAKATAFLNETISE